MFNGRDEEPGRETSRPDVALSAFMLQVAEVRIYQNPRLSEPEDECTQERFDGGNARESRLWTDAGDLHLAYKYARVRTDVNTLGPIDLART